MAKDKIVKIKLKASVSPVWDGNSYSFACGDVADVPEGLAKDLCRGGLNAELVKGKQTASAKQSDKTTR